MRSVLIGFLVLLVLMLGALVVVPHFVDPDHFRTAISAGLRRVTGREVVIAGPIRLSFLPVPTLSAGDVRIANPTGAAEPDLLRIATADLRLAIPPLLTGRLVLRSVILTDPVLDLERLADGRVNWRAPTAADAGSATPQGGGAAQAAGGESSISVTALRIVNGAAIYHAAGETEQLDHLEFALNTNEVSGAMQGTGRFRAYHNLVSVDFSSERPGERMPFHLTVGLPGAATGAELTGDLAISPDGAPSVAGTLRANGDNLAAALAALGYPMPTTLARKISLSGDLAASRDEIKLANLVIASDEIRGGGALRIVPGTPADIELSLALSRIDLDALAAANPGLSNPTSPSSAQPTGSPPSSDFVIPPELRGRLDLSIEALTWHGGLARELHLQSAIDHGTVAINRFAALLPGGSDLSFNGALSSPGGALLLNGALEANSDNLRQLLDWLDLPVGAVPAGRLRKASLSSRFTATPEHIAIDDLDVTVDATRLTGAVDVALRQRVAFGARLAVDRLNLDAYIPQSDIGGAAAATPASSSSSVRASGQHAAAPQPVSLALLDRFDANLDATIGALTWQGQPANGIHLTGTLQHGEMTIEDARIADLAGASATFNGAIGGLSGNDPHWRARIISSGPEIDHLLRLAAPGLDPTGRLSGPFSFNGDVQGEQTETAIDMTLEALGGTVRISGEVAPDATGAPAIDASLEASHPSFARLARTIAPGYQPAGGDPGAVTLAGKLHGGIGRLTLDDAALAIGPLSIAGDATLDATRARPKLSGTLSLGDLVLDRFLPARQTARRDIGPAGTPQPGIELAQATAAGAASAPWSREKFEIDWLKAFDADFTLTGTSLTYAGCRIDQPALAVTLQDAALDIGRLSGGFVGGVLDGSVHLDAGGDPRITASVSLHRAALKDALETLAGSGILDGRADLDLALTASGRSPAEVIDGLAGKATLASKDGTISGVDLAAASARLEQAKRPTDLIELFRGLSGGTTRYTALDGTFQIADGVLESDDLHFAAAASDGTARLTADLPHWQLHSRIEFHLIKDGAVPPVAMTLDGPLDAPRKIFDISALEHYLAQRGAAPVTPAP